MDVLATKPLKAGYRVREACEYLGTSRNTLMKYADLGHLPYRIRGVQRIFSVYDLDNFMQSDILHCKRRPVELQKGQ